MHDINGTLAELELEEEYEGEFEGELEYEYEDENEYEWENEGIVTGVLSDAEEMELASDLLSVSSEEELEQFLGSLFKKVARKAGRFMRSKVGRGLVGVLKGVAKKALPIVGGALGSVVAPGIGTAIGSSLGGAASRLFEMEMEGMSDEDAEFEVAKRVVRIAAQSAVNAAKSPQNIPVSKIIKSAVIAAAKKHIPGGTSKELEAPYYLNRHRYYRRTPATRYYRRRYQTPSGRWYRRGGRIILVGA